MHLLNIWIITMFFSSLKEGENLRVIHGSVESAYYKKDKQILYVTISNHDLETARKRKQSFFIGCRTFFIFQNPYMTIEYLENIGLRLQPRSTNIYCDTRNNVQKEVQYLTPLGLTTFSSIE
jgi:hypothetical protein